ncbi:hypothetical protein AYO21_02983 [Fonsecaea monophora]|uniref:DUF7924 domain-containing protein n=1 Tax=Fonsecaea monophora TaxID=254056 RepID=A0A177FGF7_9EURO|nr:hypothetical protein AYO21_02983 [Fonsecaea monophora]KAH0841970.1 hypothetical protein FOPE_06803 [Fonsecaea pedrosoi]OAG42700.1 hypothetical protein AYO21_02983 [Fonsecaea monophora]
MSVSLTKTSRKSARLQEKQAASHQGTARGGPTRSLQKPVVKQSNHRKEKDKTPVNTEDELDLPAKRPRHKLTQPTETRTEPDKENLIESWLEKLSWSRSSPTENEARISEASFKMPRKPTSLLPSPDNSFEGSISTSRKSEKSTASVHDADYRQSLRDRNIYINREDPPPELIRRARRIISRSRTSPEMDDEAVQQLIRTSRRVEEEGEEAIVLQLAPDLIPAMKTLPDTRLASNAAQPWYNSVPIPLDTSILTNPLPLPKPKPDLAFGYSEAAFTRNQLGTIGLLVDDQFDRSYAVPDQKVRFPFLEIEFKSQAQNGTHYIATNQAAGAGAVALSGYIDLMQRSFGMEEFDYEEPRYFSVTIDHQFACVNVHWLRAPAEKGGQHSFHVEGLSQHLLRDANGIRALSRAIKNILDNGVDARLRTLCRALDAYRETIVRNRNAANTRKERQPEDRLKSHTGQQGTRGVPGPKFQAGVVASCDDIAISRPPLEAVQPVQKRQRGRRGTHVPDVQAGEDVPREKVRASRVVPGPVEPLHAEQRPRRVPTTTRHQVTKMVEIPLKATRPSAKRDSRVMESG